MHIMHEIMHPFLDKLGYRPIYERQLTKETPVYCRLEWAVKAIAGEVMIPYKATMDMSEKEIISYYGVSPAAAKKRVGKVKKAGLFRQTGSHPVGGFYHWRRMGKKSQQETVSLPHPIPFVCGSRS